MKDMFGIVANVMSDRVFRTGAKVWVCRCNGDAVCPIVIGLSKSGHQVTKYTKYKRLRNFRATYIPEHLRAEISLQWADKADATAFAHGLADVWTGVRYFSRGGLVLLQDGVSQEGAFKHHRPA